MPPEGHHILMLVPHDPKEDPRVEWAAASCLQLAPTRVIAIDTRQNTPLRSYDGSLYVEKVDLRTTSSTLARLCSRVGSVAHHLGGVDRYTQRRIRALETGNTRRTPLDAIQGFLREISLWGGTALLSSALFRRARSESIRPRVVVAHDIFGLIAGVGLKKLWGVPLVYDAHEFWPAADPIAPAWPEKLLTALERSYIRRADRVITVTPQLASHLETTYGLSFVASVPNAPPMVDSAPTEEREPGRLRVLLQGRVVPGRGVRTVLQAWRRLGGVATLFVRSPATPYWDSLASEFGDLVDQGALVILPAVSQDRLISDAQFADVGLIPYPGIGINHEFACPNKLGEYLAAGLGVLSSDLAFVRDVIEKSDCGMVFESNRPSSLEEAVRRIAGDPKMVAAWRRNARLASAREFNWESVSVGYQDAIAGAIAG